MAKANVAARVMMIVAAAMATDAVAQTQSQTVRRASLEVDVLWAGLDGAVNEADVHGAGAWTHPRPGGRLAFRAGGERSAFLATVVAVSLSAYNRIGNDQIFNEYRLDADQLMIELDYAHRMSKTVELVVGARFLSCRCSLASFSVGPGEGWGYGHALRKSWVEPVIGLQAAVPLSDLLTLAARADAGTFLSTSSRSWQLMASLDMRLSRSTTLRLGLRSFSSYHETDVGTQRQFTYDLRSAGPLLGIVISL